MSVPAAADTRGDPRLLPERIERATRLPLHREADRRVEKQHEHDGESFDVVAGDPTDRRRRGEKQNDDVQELIEKNAA